MEERKYSEFANIRVDELPLKFRAIYSGENYPKIFKDNNITNLQQLFVAYDNGTFNDGRKAGYKSLKGIIEILKYVYLEEPLIADSYFDLNVYLDAEEGYSFPREIAYKIRRLGVPFDEIFILENYLKYLNEIDPEYPKKVRLYNLMSSLTTDKNFQMFYHSKIDVRSSGWYVNSIIVDLQNLIFKISVFEEYYIKKNCYRDNPKEMIELLEKQLKSLDKIKNSLDLQIEILNNQINLVNESKVSKK